MLMLAALLATPSLATATASVDSAAGSLQVTAWYPQAVRARCVSSHPVRAGAHRRTYMRTRVCRVQNLPGGAQLYLRGNSSALSWTVGAAMSLVGTDEWNVAVPLAASDFNTVCVAPHGPAQFAS